MKEGDIIVYRKNKYSKGIKVKIIKIHYDVEENYYTIEINDKKHIQTILSKLDGPLYLNNEIVLYKNRERVRIVNYINEYYQIELLNNLNIIKYTTESNLSFI
jgi:hypothetical protein